MFTCLIQCDVHINPMTFVAIITPFFIKKLILILGLEHKFEPRAYDLSLDAPLLTGTAFHIHLTFL